MNLIINDVHLGPQVVDPNSINTLYCDIDGTIADLSHRKHWIMTNPKNWDAFDAEMHLDKPIQHIIDVLHILAPTTDIFMVSGRSDRNENTTNRWLKKNNVPYDGLFMRKHKDYRDDQIIKKELLNYISNRFSAPDLVLDDRDRVVKMWRDNGYRCIQVAEGNF